MPKQPGPKAAPAPAKAAPGTVVIVGAVCLAVGLLLGYYFGKENAVPFQAASGGAPPISGTVPNPATFLQDEAALKTVLRNDPKNLDTLIQLGNLYYDHGRFQEAVEYYGRALEIDPKNVSVRTDRGTSYWSLGQADPAIAEFQKSLEVDPGHAQTLYNLGVVQMNGKNNPQEARKAWEKLLASNPNYPERAKVLEQLNSLTRNAEQAPASGQGSPGGVEDLLQRMKSKK
jgi:cytochrome c-type biogenesis protein CcmH/NrfG